MIKTIDGNRIGEGFAFMLGGPAARAEMTLAGGLDRWVGIKYFTEYIVEVEDGRQLRCFVTRMTPIVIGAKQLVTLDLRVL